MNLFHIGGNCVTNMLKESVSDSSINFIPSPFAGTYSIKGIFSSLSIQNGFNTSLQILNNDNNGIKNSAFSNLVPLYRENLEKFKFEAETAIILSDYMFLHIDLKQKENFEKVKARYESFFQKWECLQRFVSVPGNYLVYCLNDIDMSLTSTDITYYLYKMKIPENKIIILFSQWDDTPLKDQNGKPIKKSWLNFESDAFSHCFSNVFKVNLHTESPKCLDNSFLDFVKTLGSHTNL